MSQSRFYMPQSRVTVCQLGPDGRVATTHNEALPWWGYVCAKAVSEGGYKWRIRKVYVEFENLANPSTVVSVPNVDPFNPDHALPYYAALADSSSRDYLRVDLRGAPELTPESGYEDFFAEFPEAGNLLRAFAQTAGTVGTHGKTFSNAVNSKVCGTALVAAPVENDATQDIVVARAYFTGANQLLKLPGMQIGVSWESPFVIEEEV